MRQHAARRIKPGDQDVVVAENRVELFANIGSVAFIGVDQPLPQIVARNIVIAGDAENRRGQTVQEIARRPEFPRTAYLREVPADDDQARLLFFYGRPQGLHDSVFFRAEMQVR